MSAKATVDEKIVRDYTEVPLLEELDLPGLLARYRQLSLEIGTLAGELDIIQQSIRVCVDAAEADTVLYTDENNLTWRSTVVRPKPSNRLIKGKLERNMMVMGKLDAKLVGAILTASHKKGEPRDPYVKITDPYNPKPVRENEEEE